MSQPALYRLSSKTYPDTTNVEYTYDLANKVLQVADPTGTYGFAYDNMGRLISTTTNYTFVAGTYTNSYSYDAASNRTSLTAPDGSISTYGYDTLNRLNGLANSWAGSFGFSYDALSRRTQLTRPNGVNTNYSYDSLSHLLSVLHQAGVNTLDGASYTYDPAGNRTAKTNYLSATTSNYTYDQLYELTQVTQGASTTESYSYDPVGNRLSSSGVPNYNYNVSNELTSNSSGSYAYDANGNTLSDPSGKSYTWDFENRLIQAVVPGTGTTTFRYDPFGRRIQKSGPLGTTNYLYDGSNLIEGTDQNGNLLARYTDTLNLDEPLSELVSGAASYYERDGLGSVTSLTNSSGAVANSYVYDSYGRLTASTGTIANPFQYTDREFDPETGIYEYRARYYDQNVGRFIGEDPIRFKAGTNFYRYARNTPTFFTDPFGLKTCTPVFHFSFSYTSNETSPLKGMTFVGAYSEGPDDYTPYAILTCVWDRNVVTETYKITKTFTLYKCFGEKGCGDPAPYYETDVQTDRQFMGLQTSSETTSSLPFNVPPATDEVYDWYCVTNPKGQPVR